MNTSNFDSGSFVPAAENMINPAMVTKKRSHSKNDHHEKLGSEFNVA